MVPSVATSCISYSKPYLKKRGFSGYDTANNSNRAYGIEEIDITGPNFRAIIPYSVDSRAEVRSVLSTIRS